MNDPRSGKSNLFSGRALYFTVTGAVTVNPVSNTSQTLLEGAKALTVSLAVLPLADLSGDSANDYRVLVQKQDTFSLVLEKNRQLSASVVATLGGKLHTFSMVSQGPELPLSQWSHVTLTDDPAGGVMTLFVNGAPVSTQTFAGGATLNVDSNALVFGPNAAVTAGSGDASTLTYALDQVGISRVIRTQEEINRQATLVFPRLSPSQMPNALPLGIQPPAVASPVLASRPLDSNLVTLGKTLFFDPRLSPDNRVSCSSCHASATFTESAPLHLSRIQEHPCSRRTCCGTRQNSPLWV